MPSIKANVVNNSVTFSKTQNIATDRILGRSSASSGPVEELTIGSGLVLNSTTLSAYGGGRLPCWENPPISPGTYNDEFNTGSLAGAWTISSVGTTNPATTGTIDYTASLTTPIVDAATVPSWLMLQSDNSSAKQVYLTRSYTPATNETWFMRIGLQTRRVSANNVANIQLKLSHSTDSNEWISFGYLHTTSTHRAFGQINNNGTLTTPTGVAQNDLAVMPGQYLVLWKEGNVYRFGYGGHPGPSMNVQTLGTKTGVTAMDQIQIQFETGADTPSIIEGIDFVRYYTTLEYSFVNP